MKVDFSRLAGLQRGEDPFLLEAPMGEILPQPPADMTYPQPVVIKGILKKDEDGLSVVGEATVLVEGSCSLCLKPVQKEVSCPFEEQLTEDDTDIITGNTLDMTDIAAAALMTHLPMKLECSDDCKGLCPICGKDLNTGKCECNTTRIDPRFEQIRALFKLDEEV